MAKQPFLSMQRERITDHIFVFRSDQYAQVTAGVVLTDDGAVLIDTLLYPEETIRIRRYVEDGLGASVKYVINTHFHADHTTGTCFFPGAQVIAHRLCRELLDRRGRHSLRQMKKAAPEFESVRLVLPDITFEDQMTLKIGATSFLLRESPGHSPDSIICLLEEEEVLFAADTVMPIPYFVDGSFSASVKSLSSLLESEYENIVQGHGDIILRGEAPGKIASDLEYLRRIDEAVKAGLDKGQKDIENQVSLAHCGKSHVLLNGAVEQLHRHNVRALLDQYRDELERPPESHSEDQAERGYAWHQKKLI